MLKCLLFKNYKDNEVFMYIWMVLYNVLGNLRFPSETNHKISVTLNYIEVSGFYFARKPKKTPDFQLENLQFLLLRWSHNLNLGVDVLINNKYTTLIPKIILKIWQCVIG